jgi:hypothetical protein
MFKINVKKEMQIAILKQMHVRNTCPIMWKGAFNFSTTLK